MKKGFTLIELLIVIAIIGILAAALLVSLGGARKAGRDARRAADLRTVQNALELYYNVNAYYPTATTWSGLETALEVPALGISNIPLDPSNAGSYVYGYCPESAASPQTYVLGAKLETDSTLLDNDLDAFPANATFATCAGFATVDCVDDPAPVGAPFGYCVSL